VANHNINVNPMLTISEVAHILNVHINTVRRWSNDGTLKAYRIGSRGDRRFRYEDVDKLFTKESK
jgi:excisionase family DNA binding protein